MKHLLNIYRKHIFWLLLGGVLSLLSYLSGIALISTSGWFIAAMAVAGVSGGTLNYFTPAAFIRACAIVRTGGRYLERLVTHDTTLRILESLRLELYKQIERIPPLDFKRIFRSGDLFNRLKNDIDSLDRFYLSFLLPVSVSIISVIIVISIQYHYSPSVALGSGALMLISLIAVPILSFSMSKNPESALVTATGNARADLSAQLQSIRELMILDTNGSNIKTWDFHIKNIISYQRKINHSLSFAQSMILFCANMSLLVTLLLILPQITGSLIEGSVVVMILMLSWSGFDELSKLPAAVQALPRTERAASRVFELKSDFINTRSARLTSDEFSLSFRDVTFGYTDESIILENFSFDLKKGDRLSIVGPTGSGKTTIINLLCGFAAPRSGNILINGVDTSLLPIDEILKNFSVVQQHPHLFDRTIEDNIRIANFEATEEALINSSKDAGLHAFVTSLPDGYNTYVGENGMNLSGGQLKRVALARAILKDAPCLILDEIGEGLDFKTEEEIINRLLTSKTQNSIIMITHRRDIAEKFDRIIDLTHKEKET